jgi:hypothetical protein
MVLILKEVRTQELVNGLPPRPLAGRKSEISYTFEW